MSVIGIGTKNPEPVRVTENTRVTAHYVETEDKAGLTIVTGYHPILKGLQAADAIQLEQAVKRAFAGYGDGTVPQISLVPGSEGASHKREPGLAL